MVSYSPIFCVLVYSSAYLLALFYMFLVVFWTLTFNITFVFLAYSNYEAYCIHVVQVLIQYFASSFLMQAYVLITSVDLDPGVI